MPNVSAQVRRLLNDGSPVTVQKVVTTMQKLASLVGRDGIKSRVSRMNQWQEDDIERERRRSIALLQA